MTASPTTEQMVEGGLRSSLLSIVINLALALVKCVAGLIGHSFALLADGIESFLDVISSSVVYYGLRLAIKPPDKDHPYGHGKADPIVSPGETAGYQALVEHVLGSTAAQQVLAVYYISGMGHGGPQYNQLIGAQIDALESWIDYRQSKGQAGAPAPANIGNYPREPAGSGQRLNRFIDESKGQ